MPAHPLEEGRYSEAIETEVLVAAANDATPEGSAAPT
jgi:hypothetical protein